jgi:hypothetical protein
MDGSRPDQIVGAGWKSGGSSMARGNVSSEQARNHPQELFGGRIHIFPGPPAAKSKEGHARVGLRPAE